MSNIISFEVKLFDVTSLAKDGSNIPRRSCETYLQSADYSTIIENKVAIGGLTHKDRSLDPKYKGIIGMDDQVLINDNSLFYVTSLHFKPGDNFLYASADTFDPDLFSGKRRENIINLIGLLRTGVRMPVSVVIQALWSKRNVAEKIVRIKGFDFTQNPSFKGAGDIQYFSDSVSENKLISQEEIKSFSDSIDKELSLKTVIFSCSGDVLVIEGDTNTDEGDFSKLGEYNLTYSDVAEAYGSDSNQAKVARQFKGRTFSRFDLEDRQFTAKDNFLDTLNTAGKDGDEASLTLLGTGGRRSMSKIINSLPEDDPNRDEIAKTALGPLLNAKNANKEFSALNTLAERMRLAQQSRHTEINIIFSSYKDYWSNHDLSDEDKSKLANLFVQDLNLLIKSVLKEVVDGKSFNSIYALSRYGIDVKDSSQKLSVSYRKLLISEKIMGYVPKQIYQTWRNDLRDFYDNVLMYVFGVDSSVINFDQIDIK